MLDLIISGGNVADGSGASARTADIGIADGKIVEIGRISGVAQRRIDADGLLVTPGFVDIHTHYDGQATWDDALYPSFDNGVTTAILGNCGVGFAPIRKGGEEVLIDLMDGVEEIPGTALHEGLKWNWETFPDFLDVLDRASHSFNIGALAAHGPLRCYVLGDKVRERKCASPDEMAEMSRLLDASMQAGAFGISSSRTPVHQSALGLMTPDYDVDLQELKALAEVAGRYGGIFEFAPNDIVGEDLNALKKDMSFYEEIATTTRANVHLLMSQTPDYPDYWREQMEIIARVNAKGGKMFGQVGGRGISVLFSFFNLHPFMTRPSFIEVTKLPRERWIAELRKPEIRARILSEDTPLHDRHHVADWGLEHAYDFGQTLDYEPDESKRLIRIAERRGVDVRTAAYDLMTAHDSGSFLYAPVLNYNTGDLEPAREMLASKTNIFAASDAGAHSMTICDGAICTFMLTHWTRDRTRGARFSIEEMVHQLSRKPAAAIGLTDRGLIAEGMAADINIIDYDNLRMEMPYVANDLPSGAPRLMQSAKGYRATMIGGVVTRENDIDTGARPGKLLRKANSF